MLLALLTTAFANPLPDLADTTSRKSCDAPSASSTGKAHPGAEQFYTGAFTFDATGNLTGYEKRYLYANPTWKGLEGLRRGKDCVDAWTVRGKKVPASTSSCKTCAFAIEIEADVDTRSSTCERRLTSNMNHFKTTYQVEESSDGRIKLRFESGKVLGEGRKEGEAYVWLSQQTCAWF